MNMVLNIRGGQINFAHTNFNILINQYLFSSAVKALSGSQCHGNSYECYFLFWLTNISCTWHFGPIFLALCPLDLNFLHFTLWSYISCTLHFGPILLALFTLDLYFLHFAHITHNISNPCPVPLMMLLMMMMMVTVSVRMMRQQESRVSELSAFVSSHCHKQARRSPHILPIDRSSQY